jgi:hypothetical protein
MESKFDNQNFFVHFISVFTVPEMKKAFQSFLRLVEKEEEFNFIERVDETLNLKKNTEIIKSLSKLYNDYFAKNSKFNISLTEYQKSELHLMIEPQLEAKAKTQWILKQSISEILEPVRDFIVQLLRLDVFPRFLQSEFCIEVLQKFPNDERIFFPKTSEKYLFSDDDFKEPIITEKDWNFMKALLFHSLDFNV